MASADAIPALNEWKIEANHSTTHELKGYSMALTMTGNKHSSTTAPSNTTRRPGVDLMLGQRWRRWTYIKSRPGGRIVLACVITDGLYCSAKPKGSNYLL